MCASRVGTKNTQSDRCGTTKPEADQCPPPPAITHHLSVAGLFVDSGHVGPVEELDELDHGLGLVLVGRDGAHEEREAVLRAQRRRRREETHLQHRKQFPQSNFNRVQKVGIHWRPPRLFSQKLPWLNREEGSLKSISRQENVFVLSSDGWSSLLQWCVS